MGASRPGGGLAFFQTLLWVNHQARRRREKGTKAEAGDRASTHGNPLYALGTWLHRPPDTDTPTHTHTHPTDHSPYMYIMPPSAAGLSCGLPGCGCSSQGDYCSMDPAASEDERDCCSGLDQCCCPSHQPPQPQPHKADDGCGHLPTARLETRHDAEGWAWRALLTDRGGGYVLLEQVRLHPPVVGQRGTYHVAAVQSTDRSHAHPMHPHTATTGEQRGAPKGPHGRPARGAHPPPAAAGGSRRLLPRPGPQRARRSEGASVRPSALFAACLLAGVRLNRSSERSIGHHGCSNGRTEARQSPPPTTTTTTNR